MYKIIKSDIFACFYSALLGFATTVIPRWLTYYASSALFAIFGVRMLREGETWHSKQCVWTGISANTVCPSPRVLYVRWRGAGRIWRGTSWSEETRGRGNNQSIMILYLKRIAGAVNLLTNICNYCRQKNKGHLETQNLASSTDCLDAGSCTLYSPESFYKPWF